MNAFEKAARTLPNRGVTHVFLGHPLSDGADKTTVEPGNSYSPGVWTCGISVWVETGGKRYCPDALKESQVEWTFGGEGARPPVLTASYKAGAALAVTHELAAIEGKSGCSEDLNRVTLHARAATKGEVHIVVKDVGPAGARIDTLAWDTSAQRLLINGCIELLIESPRAFCAIVPADREFDSPMAVISWDVGLKAGESAEFAFRTVHGLRPSLPHSEAVGNAPQTDGTFFKVPKVIER